MEDDSICKICMDAPVNFFYLQLYYKLYLRTLFSRISNYETKTRKLKESQIIFYYNLSSGLATSPYSQKCPTLMRLICEQQ